MSQNVYKAEVPKVIVQKDFVPSIKTNNDKYLIQVAIPADTRFPAVYDMVIKESEENSDVLQITINRTA